MDSKRCNIILFKKYITFFIDSKQPNEVANNTAEFGGFGGKSLLFINNRLPKVVIESGKKNWFNYL